ncbi:MAG: cell division protein FtsL [Deltaproteobacteria bacterium]|nr:cell division protein FtsL [Deltaproteobacteria bacterium]
MSRAAANSILSAKTTARQMSRASSGRYPLFVAAATIIIVLLFTLFYLWSRLIVVSLGYEIAKANKERVELMADAQRLKLVVLSLKSPQRIEAIALGRLGLVYPKREQVIIVK